MMLKNNVEVNSLTISVRTHIDLDNIADLLDSASRGSAYWSGNSEQLGYESFVKEAINKSVWIVDNENDEKLHILDLKKIKRGLTVMAKKERQHFADFISANYGQTTGDVFLQCCLFGEVIYS